VIEYVHDPLGRRIAKKVNGIIVEKYLWQGLTRLLAVYDGSDNLLMRFEYADGRMPVAMTKNGSTYYLTYDQVGSPRVVADASGNVIKKVDYDSFGNIVTDTNPPFDIPFGFAGGLHDRDTGLVRFGFRDYDPDVGRWTAKDPIFFAGGNTDLYGYVLNDPVNAIDPLGFSAIGDIYRGIVSAIGQGARDIFHLTMHGDPFARTALGVAVVSEAVPLACAVVYYGGPAVIAMSTATLANPATVESARDFVQGFVPGTAPPPSFAGFMGFESGRLFERIMSRYL
jgi:RHS repeat-associated protein